MSVIPLPSRLADGTRVYGKARDIPGTVNIFYGHRLSQHGRARGGALDIAAAPARQSHLGENGKAVRFNQQPGLKNVAKHVSILPGDPQSEDVEINAKEEREYKSLVRTYDFVKRTDKKIMGKNIRYLVEEGMSAYEETIGARRERLRSMILSEEAAVMREVIDQAQRGADWRMDEAQRRWQELEARREEERAAMVKSKRAQQYLAQCPEARSRLVDKRARETKYSNLAQIAEKEARREAEREVEGLWYGLMLKEVEGKKAREVEEEKTRATAGKYVVATLEKQIAGKLALAEEEKRVKEEEEKEYLNVLWESVRKEEMANLEREKSKRERLKKDLEEQLMIARRGLDERAREEATMERVFRELGQAELDKEKAAVKASSTRLRREIDAYMASLEALREEESRREAEVETIVKASAREVEDRRDLAKERAKEVRARLLREVLEGREQQLRAKRIAHEEENKRAKVEGELWRKESEAEVALKAQAEARRRETAARYGQELKAQLKYVENARQREREENERMLRAEAEREKEYQKLMEEAVNAPEIITPHAFKKLLKECATLRESSEQKGLCWNSRATEPRPPRLLPQTH